MPHAISTPTPRTTATEACVLWSLEATAAKSVHHNQRVCARSGGFHMTQGRSHVLQLRANVAKLIKKTNKQTSVAV